jgi:hypothetical protein
MFGMLANAQEVHLPQRCPLTCNHNSTHNPDADRVLVLILLLGMQVNARGLHLPLRYLLTQLPRT